MLGGGSRRPLLPRLMDLALNVERNVLYEMLVVDESAHRPPAGAVPVTCAKPLQKDSRCATLTCDDDDTAD